MVAARSGSSLTPAGHESGWAKRGLLFGGVLPENDRLGVHGETHQGVSVQVFPVHIHCGDLMLIVGGVIVNALVGVAATGVNGVFVFARRNLTAALLLLDRAENVEQLADAAGFILLRMGVVSHKCGPHKAGLGGQIARKAKPAHAAAVGGQGQPRRKLIFGLARAEVPIIVQIEHLKREGRVVGEYPGGVVVHMKAVGGATVHIDGGYPVHVTNDALQLLRDARHNEYEEFDPVYPSFGETARAEGFPEVAASFEQIAKIEKAHGDRFGLLGDLLAGGKLFVSDVKCGWMCLNCGYITESLEAPKMCPVCSHDQGWFIRLEMAPYSTAPQN